MVQNLTASICLRLASTTQIWASWEACASTRTVSGPPRDSRWRCLTPLSMTYPWVTSEWTLMHDGRRRITTESPAPKWQYLSQTLGVWLGAVSPTGFWEHMHGTTHSTLQHFSQSDLPHLLPCSSLLRSLFFLLVHKTDLTGKFNLFKFYYIYIYLYICIWLYFVFIFCVIWHQWCLSYRTKILISLKSLYSHLFYFCFAVLRCVTSMYSRAQGLQ